jgi:hypothetical protein
VKTVTSVTVQRSPEGSSQPTAPCPDNPVHNPERLLPTHQQGTVGCTSPQLILLVLPYEMTARAVLFFFTENVNICELFEDDVVEYLHG